jgi:hypothetical protein
MGLFANNSVRKKLQKTVVFLQQLPCLQASTDFRQNKLIKIPRGILPMWDGAQTGRADAGNLVVS